MLCFAIILMMQLLYRRVGLLAMFLRKGLSYPSMAKKSRRQDTFPPDMDIVNLRGLKALNITCLEEKKQQLVDDGHFYSHVRLNKEETTCFACGKVKYWW